MNDMKSQKYFEVGININLYDKLELYYMISMLICFIYILNSMQKYIITMNECTFDAFFLH